MSDEDAQGETAADPEQREDEPADGSTDAALEAEAIDNQPEQPSLQQTEGVDDDEPAPEEANQGEELSAEELHPGTDLEEEEDVLPKNLPDPYCHKPWREMVGGLLVVGLVVAGITIYTHNSHSPTGAGVPVANAAVLPRQMGPNGAPIAGSPVAFTTQAASAVPTSNGAEPRTAFNSAAHVIRPSVVGIRTVGTAMAGQPGFERVGSGVVVSSAGYVLTCTHVIAGASQISVSRFRHANERLPAQIVATEGDLTLLRIGTNMPLPAARFANPNALGVGDWVLALGHPFGMGLTVSAGIVGRRNAELLLPGGGRQVGLVQTDASINEGSSGGPLVNLNGEVVGLNMAIFSPSGSFSGAGFAIDGGRALDFVQRGLAAQQRVGFRG